MVVDLRPRGWAWILGNLAKDSWAMEEELVKKAVSKEKAAPHLRKTFATCHIKGYPRLLWENA